MTTNWIDSNPYLSQYTISGTTNKAIHTGADLNLNIPVQDSDSGQPVHASANGRVIFSALIPSGTWGNIIVIEHKTPAGKTIHTRYGHLRTRTVSAGDIVRRGDMIGTVGGKEWGMPNHLHFDVSESGILSRTPTHWPGVDIMAVRDNYTNPKTFLQRYHPVLPNLIDITSHIRGNGTIYQMTVMWQGSQHSQQMQTQTDGNFFYTVKNNEWEQMWVKDGYIMRGIDTSPGNSVYYAQLLNPSILGARWCPTNWAVGQVFRRNPLVNWYNKTTGALLSGQNYDSGYRETYLKFARRYDSWAHPKNPGRAFGDVIELHWLLNSHSTTPAETYFYAKGIGLVGWSSPNGDHSFVSELFAPGQRQPMTREKVTYKGPPL